MSGDDSTLASFIGHSEDPGLPLVPALTLVWHPQVERIGQIAALTALQDGTAVEFRRDTPLFSQAGSSRGSGIDHRCVSQRTVSFHVRPTLHGFDLLPGDAGAKVFVNGQLLQARRPVTLAELRAGVIISVREWVVLCFHLVRYPVVRSPERGLLGVGDAIEQVRRAVQRAAALDSEVLVRGATGTGKELVAKALHAQSKRSGGPFVVFNMAKLRPDRASADLFGHERGAFTGASEGRPGLFRSAHGGTLFLDEIGDIVPDVQRVLLRVLEDHCVQPVGSSVPRPVDVRVIAATDARLEEDVALGRFDSPLFYRLDGLHIELPLLRERREDFGVLLVHFLKAVLESQGEAARLADTGTPWISAGVIGALAMAPWPGNVRQLRNLANQLAAWDSKSDPIEDVVRPFLAESPAGPADPAGPSLLPSRDLSRDQVLSALERQNWNQTHAARALRISRETFRKVVNGEPDIRKVLNVPIDDLLHELAISGGDINHLSQRLGLDPSVLRRRLKAKRP